MSAMAVGDPALKKQAGLGKTSAASLAAACKKGEASTAARALLKMVNDVDAFSRNL